MARTAIAPRALSKNGNLNGATGTTTIDSTLVTNGATVTAAEPERMLIRVANTEGSTNTLTVKAGTSAAALRGGQGDLVVTVAATSGVQYVGPLESDKYLQSDGAVYLDFETAMTGSIEVLLLPRN